MPEWPYIVEATILPSYVQDTNREPVKIAAGDTVTFLRTLPGYPASQGWSVKYSLRGVIGSAIDFTSTAFNDDHKVLVTPDVTAGWAPGKYEAQGRVSKGNEAHLIYEGEMEISPNLSIQPAEYDTRSHARRCLDAIEATLEGRAADDILGTKIEGTEIGRIPIPQLLLFRDRYRAEVRTEEALEKSKNGRASGRRILTRFKTPG